MADGATMNAGAPPAATPGGSPPGAAAQSGQPPMGSSPATQPTQNRGMEMAGIKQVALAVQILERALPLVGTASEVGRDVHQAIGRLAKHAPPGTLNPAAEKNQLQNMMLRSASAGPQIAQMRAAQQQGAGGGGPAPSPMPTAA